MGLVHFSDNGGWAKCFLTIEGQVVAQLLRQGLPVDAATLRRLAEGRYQRVLLWRERVQAAQKNGTPSYTYYAKVLNDICAQGAKNVIKPVGEKTKGIIGRLVSEYSVYYSVAVKLVRKYGRAAIEAALAIAEKRQGAIRSQGAFLHHLLRSGCANRWVAKRRQGGRRAVASAGRRASGGASYTGIVGRLVYQHRVFPKVALDLMHRHGEAACEGAIAIRQKRGAAIRNPAGFIVFLLGEGYAHRWAEKVAGKGESELDAECRTAQKGKVEKADLVKKQVIEAVAEAVERETGVEVLVCRDGVCARIRDSLVRLPLDAADAVRVVRKLLSEHASPHSSPSPSVRGGFASPFDQIPFAASSSLPVKRAMSRAERAAEIAAEAAPLVPAFGAPSGHKSVCPRCGGRMDGRKVFRRRYRDVVDMEAERWDGIEVCGYCFTSLAKGETKRMLESKGYGDLLS